MPTSRITHHWPGDDQGWTTFEMVVEPSHPDGSDIAATQAVRMWHDVCGEDETTAAVETDDEAE